MKALLILIFMFLSIACISQGFKSKPVFNGKPLRELSFVIDGKKTCIYVFKDGAWVQDQYSTGWYSKKLFKQWYKKFSKTLKIY